MPVTYNDLCNLLESLEKVTIRRPPLPADRQKRLSQRIIVEWFRHHRKALDDYATDGAAVLSILFPHHRKDRVYGLKETSLAKKLMKILNFNNGRRTLIASWSEGKYGDLGAYVERALGSWNGTFKNKHTIPVETINYLLIQMAANNRFSDPAIQKQQLDHCNTDIELKKILIKLTNWESKWLVRLLLRQYCTLDLDEAFILKYYHFLLPDLLKLQNDFDAAVHMLRDELACYPSVPDPGTEFRIRQEASRKLKPRVGIKIGRPTFHKAWSFNHCFKMTSRQAWAAEVKYDGEYCEIHVNLENSLDNIRIFSKNGKDATNDRRALHGTIREALRIGTPHCLIKQNCVVLGEMVVYDDEQHKILPFCKIRKHISRSGSYLGSLQDSLPHEWEKLMTVFFDVLILDDVPIMTRSLQDRRDVLRNLVQMIPGRAMRSQWTLIDFKAEHGTTDLKQAFARSLANRQEGLVLKPLHAPYFPLTSDKGHHMPNFFIKFKKDYLADMGGQRDLGDFAIVGARFDASVAAKSHVIPLHWTHFYMGCLVNHSAIHRIGAKPKFRIVGSLSLDQCVPKSEAKYLNLHGRLCQTQLDYDGNTDDFDFDHGKGYESRMSIAFKSPFVAEILGGGYERLQNETFEMLRHPRLKKIHNDRTWEDCISMEDLARLAAEKWKVPDADKLNGHAKDVALLAMKYAQQIGDRPRIMPDITHTTEETVQGVDVETYQKTMLRRVQKLPRRAIKGSRDKALRQKAQRNQQDAMQTSQTVGPRHMSSNTEGCGIHDSRGPYDLLKWKTTFDDQELSMTPQISLSKKESLELSKTFPGTIPPCLDTITYDPNGSLISPPPSKRRKILSPLKYTGSN